MSNCLWYISFAPPHQSRSSTSRVHLHVNCVHFTRYHCRSATQYPRIPHGFRTAPNEKDIKHVWHTDARNFRFRAAHRSVVFMASGHILRDPIIIEKLTTMVQSKPYDYMFLHYMGWHGCNFLQTCGALQHTGSHSMPNQAIHPVCMWFIWLTLKILLIFLARKWFLCLNCALVRITF